MFPALAVTTPPASSSSVAWRIALPAPRILNESTGCSVSSFSQISASESTSSRTSGVRTRCPRSSRGRAGSRSSGITARRPTPTSLGLGAAQHVLGGGQILDGEAERLEDRDLLRRPSPLRRADQELADLGADVLRPDRALAQREEEVARLVHRRLAPVDEERRVDASSRCRARASSGCSSRRR